MISWRQRGITTCESPPVAMTVAFSPSSSSMRSIIQSIAHALEYIMPLVMQSTVLLHITRFGFS